MFHKAWSLECEVHKKDVGFQDHLHAVYGGFSHFSISPSLHSNKHFRISKSELSLSSERYSEIFSNLFLVYLNQSRPFPLSSKHGKVTESSDLLDPSAAKKLFSYRSDSINAILEYMHASKINFSKLGSIVLKDAEPKIKSYFSDSNVFSHHLRQIIDSPGCYGLRPLGSAGGGFCLVIGDPSCREFCSRDLGLTTLDCN